MAANVDAQNDARIELLVSSDEGQSWRQLHVLEDGRGAKQAARYPDMKRLPDGRIVLVYSINGKKGLKAHVFSESWINGLG